MQNVSDTGGPADDDESVTLKKEIQRLMEANRALIAENEGLRRAAEARPNPQEALPEQCEVGEDALRKRLERMCQRKKNGPPTSNKSVCC